MCLPKLALSCALALLLPAWAGATAPSRAEVQHAVQVTRQHPDLGGTTTQKTLRFKEKKEQQENKPESSRLKWLADLVRWLSETGRVLVWIVGATLAAFLLVGIRHWIKERGGVFAPRRPHLPSHVQNLDIRPESLPEAIGEAAAQLWSRGQHRPALSLLYRGALSRLVHVHGVPIESSSTEGECLSLARNRIDLPRSEFFAQLVAAWQLAVYGARLPEDPQALSLCRAMDVHLPPASIGMQAR